jgi:hypothetical protein
MFWIGFLAGVICTLLVVVALAMAKVAGDSDRFMEAAFKAGRKNAVRDGFSDHGFVARAAGEPMVERGTKEYLAERDASFELGKAVGKLGDFADAARAEVEDRWPSCPTCGGFLVGERRARRTLFADDCADPWHNAPRESRVATRPRLDVQYGPGHPDYEQRMTDIGHENYPEEAEPRHAPPAPDVKE